MESFKNIANIVEQPNYDDEVIKNYQTTRDIIKDVTYCFKKYNYQAKPIAKYFGTGNTEKDAKNIWNFTKNNFKYSAEPQEDQTTRSFARLIHGQEKVDCKHTAQIEACIAWNMGYNVFFKFVSYNEGETYGHVYCIIQNPNTRERYSIDPLQDFNTEKSFVRATNYKAINNLKPKQMLSRLSGVETEENLQGVGNYMDIHGIGGIRLVSDSDLDSVGARKQVAARRIKRHALKARRHERKAERRFSRSTRKELRHENKASKPKGF